MTSEDIFDEARAERERAHHKHADMSMESVAWFDPAGRRMRILLEELGEVAREFNDADIERRLPDAARVRAELVQVTAMAGAWADVVGEFDHDPPRGDCAVCTVASPDAIDRLLARPWPQ